MKIVLFGLTALFLAHLLQSLLALKPSQQKSYPMKGENRPLVSAEPDEFEN